MAFRNKAAVILNLKPDILIIQECEHPDKLIFNTNTPKPNDVKWFGRNKNKGLGIFFDIAIIDSPFWIPIMKI